MEETIRMMTELTAWRPQLSPRMQRDAWQWSLGFALIAWLWMLMFRGQLNLVCALLVGGTLLLVAVRSKAAAAILTLAYLNLMGDLRRVVDVVTGVPELDLLLLIGPAVALVLAVPFLLRLQLKDAISKAMFFLTAIMVLEIFNPAQGGIAVGFSGALFYIAPMLWFWIGRRLASPAVVEHLLYRAIFPLAVGAALLGLYQTGVGFFPYEQAWIDATMSSYTALSLGGTTRALGFSVSAAEYATLLELGAAGVAAAWFGRRRAWSLVFPLLLTAMLLASGRTVVVKLVFALAMVWIVKEGRKLQAGAILRLVFLLILGLGSVGFIASRYAPSDSSGAKRSATGDAIAHLSGGLAHPFDKRYSTVGVHQGMFVAGLRQGLLFPVGHGLGATTGAATKFGGSSELGSSEVDLSDMFISLGLVGGGLYLYVFFMVIRQAILYTRNVPREVGLPAFAILCATLGAWLISGQYSTSALIFFLIGATVHPLAMKVQEPAKAEDENDEE
jgi:hypothetical protein